jgi:hypothetical protein
VLHNKQRWNLSFSSFVSSFLSVTKAYHKLQEAETVFSYEFEMGFGALILLFFICFNLILV